MELKDWLVIFIIVVIVGVLLDGVRRKLRDRDRVVLKIDRSLSPGDGDEEPIIPELPNGGARTKPRDQTTPPPSLHNLKTTSTRSRFGGAAAAAAAQSVHPTTPGRRPVRPDPEADAVPVLMDTVDLEEDRITHTSVYADTDHGDSFTADSFDAVAQDDDESPDESPLARAQELDDDIDDEHEEDAVMLRAEAPVRGRHGYPESRYQGRDDDDYEDDEDYEEIEDEEDELEDELELPGDFDDDEDFDDEEDEDDEDDDFDDDYDDEDDEDDEEDDEDEGFEDEDDLDELEGLPEDDWGSDEEQDVLVDDYENEPVLLQDTYEKAANHFSRPDHRSRIEPGFGEDHFDESELDEDFGSATSGDADELHVDAEPIRPVPVNRRPEPPKVRQVDMFQSREDVSGQGRGEAREEARGPHGEQSPGGVSYGENSYGEISYGQGSHEESTVAGRPAPAVREPARPVRDAIRKVRDELRATAAPVASPEPEPTPEHEGPQEVIILNVMARPGRVLEGAELLPVLQQQGLRLGEMSIFHRHVGSDGSGAIMFSMANMVKPGTFDLATMNDFSTPGVSFFLQLPNRAGNMTCFDRMLTAANAVRDTLDGELKDENRSVFTRQTVEHCRQRILDFELRLQLLARKH